MEMKPPSPRMATAKNQKPLPLNLVAAQWNRKQLYTMLRSNPSTLGNEREVKAKYERIKKENLEHIKGAYV